MDGDGSFRILKTRRYYVENYPLEDRYGSELIQRRTDPKGLGPKNVMWGSNCYWRCRA